ncbi:hypothetical protein FGO68_gene1069 [Halteria grandinella]|uniref:Uncharacterized protein n=1 Tax=Halteria grandinella TaxID=5974 RepID=A0A8J8P3J3_HALGN|nr:hypothetical protein FGO68_gene1069 [Halteria grandinella]
MRRHHQHIKFQIKCKPYSQNSLLNIRAFKLFQSSVMASIMRNRQFLHLQNNKQDQTQFKGKFIQIFENLQENDLFGLMTLSSGKQPFVVINLERKHNNLKMKRSTLRHLNMTQRRTSDSPESKHAVKLTILQQCLRYCFESAREACPAQRVKTRNELGGPQNWVVAIVGHHQQELTKIEQYIKGTQKYSNVNLIIIGVSIYDKGLCDKYRSLCNMTPEGQFVNLNFNEQNDQLAHAFQLNGKEGENQLLDEVPSYERTFSRVEAAMQLFDSKREPYITQHIDFN